MENDLNKAQEKAILTTEGPVLIVAGAGSGKTRVLAHRISHLVERGVRPEAILAITFTNKAAGEMKSRISNLLKHGKENLRHEMPDSAIFGRALPWVGTFHSLSVSILRETGSAIGINKHFTILDEDDALSLIKEALADLALDPKQFQPTRLRSIISRKKNELVTLEQFKTEALEYFPKILARVWAAYEEKTQKSKALDFDDLLLKTVELFSKEPRVLEMYQERWRYVHVDEYQDTNLVQYHLTKLLAQKYGNICAVGDIDQAIYSWRGADFRNIMHFERDWPNTVLITLEENYRSTQLILNAANAVIVKNKFRVPKNLFSQKKSGSKISVFEAINEEEEGDFIAGLVNYLHEKEKIPLTEMAVLYRTNFQSRIIEEKMIATGIPYQVIGVKFYERKEIKDTLSYLRSALNPEDLIALKRAISMPPRGIGKALIIKMLAGGNLSEKENKKIEDFKKLLEAVKKDAEEKPASEVLKNLIKRSGLEDYFDNGTDEGEMRLANIAELASLAKRYDAKKAPEGILTLLEEAALMSDQDTVKDENSVKLMTVHAAKGLEFKAVFIAGLEDGLFPHHASMEEEKELRDEEERRLFYVALTRAKEKVYLSYAVFRTIFGSRQVNRPSNFLFDIPDELIEKAPEKIITLE
ncbi:UvrD-helicase domain-containing protein [Candidatus Giovannonibacteria bacterium]|nr:UvrD-helicase domain-containing protein [Candidatus Giovannonibacteria bacterium]